MRVTDDVDSRAATSHLPSSRLSSSTLKREQSGWLSRLARIAPVNLAVAIAAPVLSGLLLLWQAWLLSHALNLSIAEGATVAEIRPFILTIVGIIALRAAIVWVGERVASQGAERIKMQLRQTLFSILLARGPQWSGSRVSGELASTVIDQTEALDGFFVRYLPSSIAAAFLPLAFGLVLLPVDWIVALLLLITAPLIPVFMALVGWGAEAASKQHQGTLTRLSGLFADRVRGALTLRLFGRSRAEVETVRKASHDLSRKTMAVLRIAFLSSAVLEFFAALGVAGVAVYIGLSYLGMLGDAQSSMSLQAGLFCLFLAPEVYNPLRQFAANYHDRAAARAAVEQLHDVFESLPDYAVVRDLVETQSTGTSVSSVTHRDATYGADPEPVLQLSHVVVRMPERQHAVLDDVNLCLHRDQKIALMGISGSGKTTLLETICGLRQRSQGKIVFAGTEVSVSGSLSVHDRVVLISQRPFFAPSSIAENLRIAAPDADETALWHALNQACASGFVQALPDGLATRLGVGGYGLSGGQLHRLALARLFLTNPLLILLDEPTAHLDAQTRDAVLTSLCQFAKQRAMLVATHDPVVAQFLDATWRLENAKVIAE